MELKQKRILNESFTPTQLKKSHRIISSTIIKTICKYLPVSSSKIDQIKRLEYLKNWAKIGSKYIDLQDLQTGFKSLLNVIDLSAFEQILSRS